MAAIAESGSYGYFSRKIETGANVATIVAAVLLSTVLVKTYFLPASTSAKALPADGSRDLAVGSNLRTRVAGIDWNANGRTLVLALSTHCHFCTESAPFFRQIKGRTGNKVKLIGVLPQPTQEAETYLNQEGVHLDNVKQISLEQLGVAGTPTMLLADRKGIVTQRWIGKLSSDQQNEALHAMLGGEFHTNGEIK